MNPTRPEEIPGGPELNLQAHRPSRLVSASARTSSGILLAFAGLQVSLAAGAPLGRHVWGGTEEAVLPPGMRVASAAAAGALTSMAWVVAARAGLVERTSPRSRWLGPASWAIAGYMALNTVGNLASDSSVERFVFSPATAAAAVATAVVAASPG